MKKFTVKYRGRTIYLNENPRKGICECCNRKGYTQIHHWLYVYPVKLVKSNPELVLKNTTELCFTCHNVTNAIRKIYEAKPEIISKLVLMMLKFRR